MFRLGRSRGKVLSAQATVDHFRRLNGCPAGQRREFLPDADPDDDTRIERISHSACRSGHEIVLLRVDGGGHTWPGGRQYLGHFWIGPLSQDIDASDVMFRFFLRQLRKRPNGLTDH